MIGLSKGGNRMEINLAGNILALRRQHGLTQEQLAEVLGVSVGAL